jgi:hypothetical protein
MSTSIHDIYSGYSSCCGASVYTDLAICSDCKEHCGVEELFDEIPGFEGTLTSLTKITIQKNPAAISLGRIKTKKKAESSRENGKLGGRPKKV